MNMGKLRLFGKYKNKLPKLRLFNKVIKSNIEVLIYINYMMLKFKRVKFVTRLKSQPLNHKIL